MDIITLLKGLVKNKGSDLHLKAFRPPLMRIKGELLPTKLSPISKEGMEEMIYSILTDNQKQRLEEELELDFSFFIRGLARFRVNVFHQLGNLGAVFRAIPMEIKSLEELNLPPVLRDISDGHHGVVLVTGPTGSGKSTTLAAMIDRVNSTRHDHIITVEDPIEFVHSDKLSAINQREIGADTKSFPEALKRSLRQDPDIILVGEMRDQETISIAMSAAETGHLVFSTLHTNDAKQSINRIVDSFPPDQHHQVRMQLAMTLSAIISQRLVKSSDGKGRVAVIEVMINTPTIRKMIEDNKIGMIDKAIADSAELYHMQTQNQHLFKLVQDGRITEEAALSITNNRNDLRIIFQTQMSGAPVEERPAQTDKEGDEAKGDTGRHPSLGKMPSPFGESPHKSRKR